jgi:LysR family transcriptional regulator for bpeEF and oprC
LDKLRAIEYFVRVVECGGFSAAARQLEVSPPAITKMVAALERELGVRLLVRDSRRVVLTADGDRYLQSCAHALGKLREAESELSSSRTRASGKLVVGLSRVVGPNCVMPFLPEFQRRHPDVELDVRAVNYPQEPLAAMCDVLLLIGWGEEPDWVMRTIAWPRVGVVAAPRYWAERDMPAEPEHLAAHRCVAYRLPRGLVYDHWKFRRGEVTRSVEVKPYLICDDRDTFLQAVVAGIGVMWVSDLTVLPYLQRGALQPALNDWVGLEAPPIRLHWRRGGRNHAKVRVFADFVTELFQRLEALRDDSRPPPEPGTVPDWFVADHVGGLAGRWKPRGRGKADTTR